MEKESIIFRIGEPADPSFMDYSGKWYNWLGGANRPWFDNYLQTVFGWCGSASLEKQFENMVKKTSTLLLRFCARDRNRTDTPLPAADFESAASTNSATRAV